MTAHGQSQGQGADTVAMTEKDYANRSRQETTRMCRLLKLLHEYISDYDCEFQMREERTLLPMGRAYRYFLFPLHFPSTCSYKKVSGFVILLLFFFTEFRFLPSFTG